MNVRFYQTTLIFYTLLSPDERISVEFCSEDGLLGLIRAIATIEAFGPSLRSRCKICDKEMNTGKPEDMDCGGDCRGCINDLEMEA